MRIHLKNNHNLVNLPDNLPDEASPGDLAQPLVLSQIDWRSLWNDPSLKWWKLKNVLKRTEDNPYTIL